MDNIVERTRLPNWMFDEDLGEHGLEDMAEDIIYTMRLIVSEKHHVPVDMNNPRLEAKAFLESIRAMISLDSKRQQYIMWAMVQLEERGLLHYAEEEYDTIDEMAHSIMNAETKKNPKSSASFDWSFIATMLMPVLKQYGLSTLRILTMLTNDSKLRTAVPTLRFVLAHETDPLAQQERVTQILTDVMNPEVHAQDMRDTYHGHRIPMVPKISASAASLFMMNAEGGGLVTIKVDNNAQLQALSRSTRGLLEDDNSQFIPRDIRTLAKEISSINKPTPVSLPSPLSIEEIKHKLDDNNQFAGTVPMALEVLIELTKPQIDCYLSQQLCQEQLPVVSYVLSGMSGNTLILVVTIDGSKLWGDV
jgi:hypothetical protein